MQLNITKNCYLHIVPKKRTELKNKGAFSKIHTLHIGLCLQTKVIYH
jgi:hypothetical protein